MKKKIFYSIIIFIVGFLGGVSADFFLPYLGIIDENSTTIINKTEEIIITENVALEEAIAKISPALVAIEVFNGGRLVNQGTGFILTSDGLIVTALDLMPAYYDQILISQAGWQEKAVIEKKDTPSSLALLKVAKDNLSVVTLGKLEDLVLGQMIVLVGAEKSESNGSLYRFINIGHIRSIFEKTLSVNLEEGSFLANGGPLINIKGEVIGLNLVDDEGLVKTVPVDNILSILSD